MYLCRKGSHKEALLDYFLRKATFKKMEESICSIILHKSSLIECKKIRDTTLLSLALSLYFESTCLGKDRIIKTSAMKTLPSNLFRV